jgi:hypothetical protein
MAGKIKLVNQASGITATGAPFISQQKRRNHEVSSVPTIILGTERSGRKAQTRRTSICRHEVRFGPKLFRRRYSTNHLHGHRSVQ